MKPIFLALILIAVPTFGQIDKSWKGHDGGIWKINFSPEGLFFATAGDDGIVKTWWMDCLCFLSKFDHGKRKVYDAAFLPGRRSISTAVGGSLHVWNTETGDPIQKLEGHDEYVGRVAVNWEANRFFTLGADDQVIEWNGELLSPLGRFPTKSPVGVIESLDPTRLFTIGLAGLLKWDRNSKQIEKTLFDSPYAFAAGPSGDVFFLAGSAANGVPVQKRDRKTGELLATYEGAKNSVWGLATSADGRWVGVSELQGPVTVWDQQTRQIVYRSASEIPQALSLAFVPEGRGLMVGDTAGRIYAVRF